jgi:hypothetical protein
MGRLFVNGIQESPPRNTKICFFEYIVVVIDGGIHGASTVTILPPLAVPAKSILQESGPIGHFDA